MIISSPHHWPAEWEPQAATWISWPHNLETWPGRFERIPSSFTRFVTEIARLQPVHVITGCERAIVKPSLRLNDTKNVVLHDWYTNDVWIRDYGPTFVKRKTDGALVGVDWKYNAWGGKYPPYDDDAKIAEQVCRTLGCTRSVSSMYCEGGALDGDGQGTLMTTSSCLLSPTRNPGWTKDMVEAELKLQLGVKKILWVDGGGLQGDDTDGHIDQLARFVKPGVVVAATSSILGDPNRAGLLENLAMLRRSTDATGRSLEVHEMPTPPPRFIDGTRVPESYCNFLFINRSVLVPTFRNDATDMRAIELLRSLLPTREIIGVDAHELIWGLGALHCASQHQPA